MGGILKQVQGPLMYRPFNPGERRNNPDGSYSTEISMTAQDPSGAWMNFPSLWMGLRGPKQFMSEDDALRQALIYESMRGKTFPRYRTLSEAEAIAIARSKMGGAKNPWKRR